MNDDLAGQIRRNLYVIADLFDEAREPVRRAAGVKITSSETSPIPLSAHIIDVRSEAHRDLAYWAWFVLDSIRDIDGRQMVSPFNTTNITEQPSLAELTRFVIVWVNRLVEEFPDDADNLAGEAAKHANGLLDALGLCVHEGEIMVRARRDWLPIGDCPITVADADGNSVRCGAKVRAYAERQLIACAGCGTEDTLAWWMSQIVPEGSDLAHADAVIACVVSRTLQPLTHEQLRQWATRGFIMRHGKDAKGRTLYSSAAVLAYALHQTKEEAA